jgi:UDP-glucose 4-epimerase
MIFVTGGAGYIGTHTCVELLSAGLDVTVFDNFSNSQPEALQRVERITGRALRCVQGDIRDPAALTKALRQQRGRNGALAGGNGADGGEDAGV